jgi:short-subunit dehydrogenase
LEKPLHLRLRKQDACHAGSPDETKLEDVRKQIQEAGGIAAICKTDVSREEDCKNLVNETILKFGTIHVLINNAGNSMRALFKDVELKVLKELMDINFWGAVYCTRHAINEILKNKGSIVGISSIAGYKGLPGRTGYSASKFAMQGFMESLRIENLNTGIHVLIVCPGYTSSNIRNTALNKNGKAQGETPFDESKLMSAEKVADEILDGVAKRKRTIILSVQGKFTVFLNKFFPSWVDRSCLMWFQRRKTHPSIK